MKLKLIIVMLLLTRFVQAQSSKELANSAILALLEVDSLQSIFFQMKYNGRKDFLVIHGNSQLIDSGSEPSHFSIDKRITNSISNKMIVVAGLAEITSRNTPIWMKVEKIYLGDKREFSLQLIMTAWQENKSYQYYRIKCQGAFQNGRAKIKNISLFKGFVAADYFTNSRLDEIKRINLEMINGAN